MSRPGPCPRPWGSRRLRGWGSRHPFLLQARHGLPSTAASQHQLALCHQPGWKEPPHVHCRAAHSPGLVGGRCRGRALTPGWGSSAGPSVLLRGRRAPPGRRRPAQPLPHPPQKLLRSTLHSELPAGPSLRTQGQDSGCGHHLPASHPGLGRGLTRDSSPHSAVSSGVCSTTTLSCCHRGSMDTSRPRCHSCVWWPRPLRRAGVNTQPHSGPIHPHRSPTLGRPTSSQSRKCCLPNGGWFFHPFSDRRG